ncbi:MAG: HDOD domain-containing protein [Candidatus Zixiibacteriota bacterium]
MEIKGQIEKKVSCIPVLPEVAHRLIRIINDPDSCANDVADVIKHDPAITANILKAANSVYWGHAGTIDSLSSAVMRLGSRRVFEIAMASAMRSIVNQPAKGYDMTARQLWMHSAAVASVAGMLCSNLNFGEGGVIFTAALIHDLGKVVLDEYVGNQFETIWHMAESESLPFDEAERVILGIDHSEVGAKIAEKWNFPEKIVGVIRWHHNPDKAGEVHHSVDVVHVADAICIMQGVGLGRDGLHYILNKASATRLGLSTELLERAMFDAIIALQNYEQMFGTPNESAKSRR